MSETGEANTALNRIEMLLAVIAGVIIGWGGHYLGFW